MSGFPADFSEDVGEKEDDINASIEAATSRLKRNLTETEKDYLRLRMTDWESAEKLLDENPNILK